MASEPVVYDIYCGLGGWADGFLAEGYRVIGFDIERHVYGEHRYPGELVIQDARTLHGSQLKNAAVIVASPPCQKYSSRAMPWNRLADSVQAQLCAWGDDGGPCGDWLPLEPIDNTLFRVCFRLQKEASEAAGRYIPLVVENVKGAQRWVGRAAWSYGSFYLWGDVPALMPTTRQLKNPGRNFHFPEKFGIPSPSFHGAEHEPSVRAALGLKLGSGSHVRDGAAFTPHLTNPAQHDSVKRSVSGRAWFDRDLDEFRKAATAQTKVGGDWFGSYAEQKAAGTISPGRLHGKGSTARKAASAMIAKIPFELASHIARVYKP